MLFRLFFLSQLLIVSVSIVAQSDINDKQRDISSLSNGLGIMVPNGFVPTKNAAVKIATTVLIAIYGEDKVRSDLPFSGNLDSTGSVWIVKGRVPDINFFYGEDTLKVGFIATRVGKTLVKIQRMDGKILFVTDYK